MLNIKLLYDSAIPFLGKYPRELKTYRELHINRIALFKSSGNSPTVYWLMNG